MLVRLFSLVGLFLLGQMTAQVVPAFDGGHAPQTAAVWQRMIVLTDKAEVFRGNESVGKFQPGDVLHVTKQKGDWYLVAEKNAWLFHQHALPMDEAEKHFNELIQKNPKAEYFHYRGIVRSDQGQQDQAIADFDEALQRGAKRSSVLLNRGIARMRSGDLVRAIKDFDQSIQLDQSDAKAFFNRSLVYSEQQNPQKALADLDQAIQLKPDFAEAYNNRGLLYQELGQIDKALADFDRAIALRVRFPGALTNRAYLRQERQEYDLALQDYAMALRFAPDAHFTLNDLAWLLATCPDENLRQGEQAVSFAKRACELTEFQVPDYLDTLAAAYAESGDFVEAVKWAEKALSHSKDDAFRKILESRVELFRNHKPYHEPKTRQP